MFAVHVSNPFGSAKRTQERENAVLDSARKEREARDATRAAAWSSSARQAEFGRQMNQGPVQSKKGSSLAERSKYQFEADSEDEGMEVGYAHFIKLSWPTC
jgi:protein transport protein SEC9